MKKLVLIIISFAAILSPAQRIITLDLKPEVDNGTYVLDNDKGLWDGTYDATQNILSFNNGMFNFSHIPGLFGGSDVGGGMSYWDGFTLCNSGDQTDYGMMGNSDGWVSQQWGCMAGGGLNGNFEVEQGLPYLVAYWGYFYESENVHSCQVDFDGNLHKVKGAYICNHPWPYYGNLHGDGFASAFDYPGCFFTITAHGLIGGEDTGSEVTMTLAEYADDETGLQQSADWQWMDLEDLGEVDAIYFTMASSDSDPLYGSNTAVYFCLDRLQIYEHTESEMPLRPSGLNTSDISENQIVLHWNDNHDADSWMLYLNDSLVAETFDTLYCYTGLEPYEEYTLKVIAQNSIGQSDAATITAKTLDLTAPTMPTDLEAVALSPYSIQLNWTASADNVGVARYRVYLNGVQESRPKTNTYTLTGLDPDTEYSIQVEAIDEAGNVSEQAATTVRTQRILPSLPVQPKELNAVEIGETEVVIQWQDDTNADSWMIYLNDILAGESTEPQYTLGNLKPFTEYSISIVAKNAAGQSTASVQKIVTIDQTAPSVPTELAGDNSTAYTIALSWARSIDNDTVAVYNIYLNEELIATTDSTTYTIADLDASEEYQVAVEAVDRAGNVSDQSTITVSTSDDDPMAIHNAQCPIGNPRIFDLQGNPIYTMDINNLPSGIYIINNKKIRVK